MAVNNRWREGKGYIKCEIMNMAGIILSILYCVKPPKIEQLFWNNILSDITREKG